MDMNMGYRKVVGRTHVVVVTALAAILVMLPPSTAWAQGASKVYLKGHVKNPGEFDHAGNPTLYSLLVNHSGLTDDSFREQAYLARGEIIRVPDGDRAPEIISFSVEDVLNQEPGSDIPLMPQDLVRIYSSEVTRAFEDNVWITGFVKKPGEHELTEGMTLADLLIRAGGFTAEAYMMDAEVSRVELHGIPGDTLSRTFAVPMLNSYNIPDNPEAVLSQIYEGHTPASDFKLQPYDQVHIRRNPDMQLPNSVTVSGQVVFPGTFTLETRGETLSRVIERAGGLTSDAFVEGGRLLRAVDQPGVDRQINLLRQEVKTARENMEIRERAINKVFGEGRMAGAQGTMFPFTSGRLGNANATIINEYRAAIRQYQSTKAAYEKALTLNTGMKRINVDFHAFIVEGDLSEDVVLMPGDRIEIPKHPGTVTVIGQVNNPGVFNHAPGKRMMHYVKLAGGVSQYGGRMIVTQPTGYSYELEWLSDPVVMEGATIRVLPKRPSVK